MASIATCPQCAKQLAVPEDATSTDHAECPLCEATFLLANVVRLSVPPARIISSNAPAEEPTSPALEVPTLAELQAEAAPVETLPEAESIESTETPSLDSLPSWEARLKRAIESDATELSSTDESAPEPSTEPQLESTAPSSPASFEQPEFEFQLDTPPQAETFSPETFEPATSIPTAEESPSPSLHETFEAEIDSPELPTRRTDTEAEDAHAALNADLLLNAKQRSQGRSWVKIAAATATTGVFGTVLGLYTLIWLSGPSADFVGLANYLPAAMLPAAEASPSTETNSPLLAENPTPPPFTTQQEEPAPPPETTTQQPDNQPIDTIADAQPLEDAAPLSTPPAAEPLASVPAQQQPIRQDPAVQPANVEQPIAEPPAAMQPVSASIPAEQFSQFVLEAQAAQPQFLTGDFSSPQSTAQKGRAYMTLCQLAEHFDFTHQFGLAPAVQTEVNSATNIFDQLFNNPAAQADLAKITSSWWGHSKRSNQGIFLTGVVQQTQPMGTQTLCTVLPGGQASLQPIPVLVDRASVDVGSRVGVVGRIATQQESQVAELGINLPQIVVSLYSDQLP